ncbi:sigma-70 family RNA polymerase sigma factor [Streptomyces sp. NPDC048257]|uniref:sigma-70 family RNA polymerase sigma factor n=1 Tax=Streptomyces sp. NPDC048257 TaxID=3365526 RepID=UPI00371052C4
MLRTWMDQADRLTISALHLSLTSDHFSGEPVPSRSTVGLRLAGCGLTEEFVDAVAAICFPDERTRSVQAEQAKQGLRSPVPAPVRQPAGRAGPLHRAPGTVVPPNRRPVVPGTNVEELLQLVSRLQMNVAECGKRLARTLKELDAVTHERDRLRRECEAVTRHVASLRNTIEKRAGQEGQEDRGGQAGGPDTAAGYGQPTRRPGLDTGGEADGDEPEGDQLPPGGPAPLPGPRTPGASPSERTADADRQSAGSVGPRGRGAGLAMMPDSDLAEATARMPRSFKAFHALNYRGYAQYAFAQLPSRAAAEEAVTEAFAVLLANWHSFLSAEQPAAWAWKVLRHTVQSHPGFRTPEPRLPQLMDAARGALERLEGGSLGLYEAIARLPGRQFDVIVMRHLLGYSSGETANLLGVSPSTVRSLSHSARRRLARELHLTAEGVDEAE